MAGRVVVPQPHAPDGAREAEHPRVPNRRRREHVEAPPPAARALERERVLARAHVLGRGVREIDLEADGEDRELAKVREDLREVREAGELACSDDMEDPQGGEGRPGDVREVRVADAETVEGVLARSEEVREVAWELVVCIGGELQGVELRGEMEDGVCDEWVGGGSPCPDLEAAEVLELWEDYWEALVGAGGEEMVAPHYPEIAEVGCAREHFEDVAGVEPVRWTVGDVLEDKLVEEGI